MVINPGELAATLSWFRPTGCPRLDIHDPAMHRLWHFRTSISQEQEDRRSSWALGFRVPPSLSANAVTLHCLNLEIPITLGNILASWRRLKGGFVRVAHERGPTTPRFNGDRVQALCNRFWLPHGRARCRKSNFDWEDAWQKLDYWVCLLADGVSSFLGFFSLRYCPKQIITDIQTFPNIRFHLLIFGFSVGSQSPANFSKCQSTLISPPPPNIISSCWERLRAYLWSWGTLGLISLSLYSALIFYKATDVSPVTPDISCGTLPFIFVHISTLQ